MNLRGMANGVTKGVNPNIQATLYRSNGYTIGDGRKQVPAYDDAVTGYVNVQALDSQDLKQLDGLNVQGIVRTLYLTGSLAGVVRPDSKGGDKVVIASGVHAGTWLVVKVLEAWEDWTKVVINRQMS